MNIVSFNTDFCAATPPQISVNTNFCTVTYEDEIVNLHPKEYKLLLLFLEFSDRVLSYDLMIEKLWDIDHIPTYSGIRSHIKNLRKAFKKVGFTEELIETVHGIGYRLNFPLIVQSNYQALPPISVVKNLMKARKIEYLIINRSFSIKYLSPGILNYSSCPSKAQIGSALKKGFPELIEFEESFKEVLNQQTESLDIKAVALPFNSVKLQYVNLCVTADRAQNTSDSWENRDLFIFLEDVTEDVLCKQRLFQRENEYYLLLEQCNYQY